MFAFRLDTKSGVPPYLQLVQQVRQALQLGYLRSGDRLPLIREVVEALAINPNTVAKAYRKLEQEGLTEGRPGQGTFITARSTSVPPTAHTALLRDAKRWVVRAYAAGLDDDAVTAIVAAAQREVKAEGAA